MEMTGRVLLLGEDNPWGANPEFALYCYPPGCAGYRLRRIFGLPQHQYLGLHRKNLCDDTWSMKAAIERCKHDLLVPLAPWNVIVLLGRKVTEAMQRAALIDQPILPFTSRTTCPGMTLICLPHPSGRNAASWSGGARDRAREMMRLAVPELPWGSAEAEGAAA